MTRKADEFVDEGVMRGLDGPEKMALVDALLKIDLTFRNEF